MIEAIDLQNGTTLRQLGCQSFGRWSHQRLNLLALIVYFAKINDLADGKEILDESDSRLRRT